LCLFADPFAQARFQRALGGRIEGAERQAAFRAIVRHHQHRRLLLFDRDDRGRKADADGLLHSWTRGSAVVTPSATIKGGPIAASASIMRPPRPSASSAWPTS